MEREERESDSQVLINGIYWDQRYPRLLTSVCVCVCQVLVNGIYWDQRYPRLLTRDALHALHRGREEDPGRPLLVVADLSCDVHGSVEFLERTTRRAPYGRGWGKKEGGGGG